MKKRILITTALSAAGIAGTIGLAGSVWAAPQTLSPTNSTSTVGTSAGNDAVKESSTAAETPEVKTAEADGPGGHQDTNGLNVDHQFQNEE